MRVKRCGPLSHAPLLNRRRRQDFTAVCAPLQEQLSPPPPQPRATLASTLASASASASAAASAARSCLCTRTCTCTCSRCREAATCPPPPMSTPPCAAHGRARPEHKHGRGETAPVMQAGCLSQRIESAHLLELEEGMREPVVCEEPKCERREPSYSHVGSQATRHVCEQPGV